MTKTQTKPQYVNLQPTAVQMFDEHKHAVTVLPWSMRAKNPNGTYVVTGVHYQQFVGGRGPLYPFPADPNKPAGPLGETEDARHARMVSEANHRTQVEGLQASANRGSTTVAGRVVRQPSVAGESPEAFAARLRPLLVAAGFGDWDTLRKAPKHDLLKVPGITEENLVSVRQYGEMIYADSKTDSSEAQGVGEAKPPETAPAGDDEDLGELNQYPRKDIERMGRAKLIELVQAENFEGLSVEGTAAQIRERVIAALEQYKMLTD